MMLRWLAPALLFAATIVPKTAMAVTSAELYRPQAYVYGRFEARVRFAPGDGVISSFFLWKDGSEVAGAFWNELDFEKLGADCHLQTNAIFGAPSVGHSLTNAIAADLCASYHDYRFEWTPTYIAWVVDGQEIRRDTGATALAFSQNATAGMAFHFNIWPGDASFGGNFDPAILPVRQYISWVQYSSYVNGAFQLQWREEFNGAALPTGWATGNWASPKNLSTHSPQNISFVDGIAVLSLTADNATGFTGVPPMDSAGAGGAGGAATASAATSSAATVGAGGAATVGAATVGVGGAATGGGATASAATVGAGGAATVGAGAGGAATTGAATVGGSTTNGSASAGVGASVSGSGGAAVAAGSTSSMGNATAGVGGNSMGGGATPETPADSGCSCRLADRRGGASSSLGLGMLGLWLLRRRRDGRARRGLHAGNS